VHSGTFDVFRIWQSLKIRISEVSKIECNINSSSEEII
jgi:hypothetical protein